MIKGVIMKKAKKRDKFSIIILILICLLTLITAIYPNIQKISHAEDTTTYSTAIEDLQKDENFNAESYPVNEKDRSLQVIQIAESINKELFVYVYQPSAHFGNLTASSINISPYSHEDINVSNYKLQLLNNSGVFYKYKAIDFTVSDSEVRYYEIPSIFRPWEKDKDNDITPTNENTIDEVSYQVAKMYIATTRDGKVTYSCSDSKVKEIDDKYVGLLRYNDELGFDDGNLISFELAFKDNYFIAFSTEIPIEQIYSAKISYVTQYAQASYGFMQVPPTDLKDWNWEYDDPIKDEITIEASETDLVDFDSFWIHETHEWNLIQSIDEFKQNEDYENVYSGFLFDHYSSNKITDEGIKDLEGMDWVLRFASTDTYYKVDVMGGKTQGHFTNISDVTILQLYYYAQGNSYNLGVVDNKQTGDGEPDNIQESWAELKDWAKWVLGIIGAILLVVLIVACMPLITIVLKAVAKVIVWICKGIWYVISAPFTIFKK